MVATVYPLAGQSPVMAGPHTAKTGAVDRNIYYGERAGDMTIARSITTAGTRAPHYGVKKRWPCVDRVRRTENT